MPLTERIQVFESSSEAYHRAFQLFLDHTDQKTRARESLGRTLAELEKKRVFIDAGAGNGKVTAWFSGLFEKTVAVEPNPSLRRELAEVCPQAEVLPQTILEAPIRDKADFILSSHVFYYIPQGEWMANLECLINLLAPEGRLIVILQNHQSDCMQMLRHFLSHSFDLKKLAAALDEESGDKLDIQVTTVPSLIAAPDLEKAFGIAEFMLNLLPLQNPPASADVQAYIRKHFTAQDGFRFSCNQDFLQIRLR